MFSSSASAPACSISLANFNHASAVVPLSEPITGILTAAFTRRTCSRYSSGPSAYVCGSGKYEHDGRELAIQAVHVTDPAGLLSG